MRITNGMLISNYLNNLNRTMSRMQTYQEQLSSNRRINRISDDPIGAVNSLSVRGKLSRIEQYMSNIDDANAWLTQSETAVLEMNDVVKTAYEKTVQVSSSSNSIDEKRAVATELTELRDHIVQLANTTYGDSFIFGGYQTTKAPFRYEGGTLYYQDQDVATLDAATLDALGDQKISYEIGTGLTTDVSFNGIQFIGRGADNIVTVLDDLITDLNSDTPSQDLDDYIGKLQKKQNDVLALATAIGGRTNRLDLVRNRFGVDELNYATVKANVEDVDMAETVMLFKMTEAVYTSALSVGSKIIQPSLVDFLR